MMKKILHNPQALIGLALIALVTAVGTAGACACATCARRGESGAQVSACRSEFPLGTDQLGRCELSRLLYGARASLGTGRCRSWVSWAQLDWGWD